MTDELTGVGSAEAGNPDSGNGTDAEGSASNAAAADKGLEKGNPVDIAKAKGWLNEDGTGNFDKAVEGYTNLEKLLGNIRRVPDEKAKPEEWDAFHKSQGWPGEAAKYDFKKPADMPADMPYDEGFATTFKEKANELKMPATTAQALHDWYISQFAGDVSNYAAELGTKAKAADEAIVKEWGERTSESYTQNKDAAIRALRNDPKLSGLEAELMAAGLLTKEGYYTSPRIAFLLASHGKQIQNDRFVGNGKGDPVGGNPFAGDNATAQAQAIKADPVKARELAAAAGWTPEQLALIRIPGQR